jgi:hypothetical protein
MDGYGAQSGTYNIHTCGDGSIDVKKRLKDADIKGFAGFFKAIKTSTWKEIKEGKTIVECAR